MRRRVDRQRNARIRRFAGHLVNSSLGTTAAAALRDGMSREEARRVVAYAREIASEEVAERKRIGGAVAGARMPTTHVGRDVLIASPGVVATEGLAAAGWTPTSLAGERPRDQRQYANELYRSARGAVVGRRPYDAAALVHKALRLLDGRLEPEDVELRVRSLTTLCWSDMETRGLADGLVHLRMAESEVAEIADRRLRRELTSTVRAQRGSVLMRAGRYAESIAMLSQAVEIDECEHADGVSNHLALATHLLNRALAYNAAGLPEPARADLLRCADIVKVGQLDTIADRSRFAALAAEALHNLGVMAQRDGDAPRALRYFDEVGTNCRELPKNAWFRMRLDQVEALLAVGLTIEAARHLDDAFIQVGRSGDDTILADANALRSAVALAAGDRLRARKFARHARRRFLRLGDQISAGIAGLIGLRAEVGDILGPGCVPASLVSRARALARELARLQLVDEAAVARLLIVRLELSRGGRLDDLPALRQITTMEGRVLLRLCRAQIAFAGGDRRTVLTQARAALTELVEMQETSEPIDTTSSGWTDIDELCGLALKVVSSGSSSRRTAGRLFEWSERIRTQMRRCEPSLPVDDPSLSQRVQECRRLSRAIREARIANRPWRELAARRRELHGEVMRASRRYTRAPAIAGLDEVIVRLGDRALVSYMAVGDELVAVVVADGRTRMARLGSAKVAFTAARELHADLAALSPDNLPPILVDAVSRSARSRANRLDAQLVRPLREIVADRELVVAPTGMLFAVAWGALPSLTGRPMAVVPSATSWLAAVRASAGGNRRRTVLVGGPGLSPAAVGEIGRLRQYRPDAWLLDGGLATTAIVLDALDGAGLAHLVAHGAHEPQNSLFSHIELADGAVYAHEMARLARPPEHLVLAACELAFSQGQLDCDALGFAGVLLDAGSRTIVAAVSRVGDESAAAAMAHYHSRLAAGALPAEALADAVAVDPLRRPFLCVGASTAP